MSSFWQTTNTKIRLKPSKTLNQSLPTLTQHNLFKSKGSLQSIHHSIEVKKNSNHISNVSGVEQFISKKSSIIKNKLLKKQTLTSLYQRSAYKLPSKQRPTDLPTIDFGQALIKIQQVFAEQFSLSQSQSKTKKHQNKVSLRKLRQLENRHIQTNLKRYAKREFEEIFKLFDRKPLREMQNKLKEEREEGVQQRTKRFNNNHLLNRSKSRQTRQMSQQRRYEEYLTQRQKQEFMKNTRIFQKAQQHLLLKCYTVKILYHHLNAQLAIQSSMFQQAIQSLYYCQYYARKIDFDFYIVPCLIMQSEVKQSLNQFDEAVNILKTALEFTIVKKWKELQMRVLEKVSIVYYYRGNSYMARYYKELSEIGMPLTERQIYIKEYSKSQELRSLEARLFSLPFDGINKKKHNEKYQIDISRELFLDHQNRIITQHEEVSSMLRSNKTSKIGIKLRKLIIQNCQRAEVIKYSPNKGNDEMNSMSPNHIRHLTQVMPRFVSFDYPMDHCNQILKSHLSKGRVGMGMGYRTKGVNFLRTFGFMKTLYRRLSFQLISERREERGREFMMENKENIGVGMGTQKVFA